MSVKKEDLERFIDYAGAYWGDEESFNKISEWIRLMPTVDEETETTIKNSDELGFWNK